MTRNDTCLALGHVFVYADYVLASNPPQRPWICRRCGEEGRNIADAITPSDYEKIRQQFREQSGESK